MLVDPDLERSKLAVQRATPLPSIARALAFERTDVFAHPSDLYFAIDGMMAYFT